MYTKCARTVTLSISLALLLVGCKQKTQMLDTGTVASPEWELPVGARYVNFQFCNPQGRIQSLADTLGQFTVIAFTSCDAEYNPGLTHLADFVDRKSNWQVRVVGIDIFWTPQGCVPGNQCAALPDLGRENFLAICDGNGIVRKGYGVREGGSYFIINPSGKVAAKGDIRDIDCLHATLTALIDDYLKEQEYFLKES